MPSDKLKITSVTYLGKPQGGYQPSTSERGYQPAQPPVSVKPPSGGSNVTPPPSKKE